MAGLQHGWDTFYNDILDDRSRYFLDDVARGLPVIGNILRSTDSVNFYDDYFRNRPNAGGYGNIKYHGANLGLGSSVSSAVRSVSKNIENFYDNW